MRLLVGIGGGIAAYKVCSVISTLFQEGIEVRVVLTTAAQQFITPLTVATLARHPAYTDEDFWQPIHQRPLHIELGEWADLILIAPLTANTLAKLANGLADNLLTNIILASACPVLLAPAMNTDMWEQVAVQRNWQLLQQDRRYHWCDPGAGLLACDRVGRGRLAEPATIMNHVRSLFITRGKRDLTSYHILISTGGTREFLDPVRFIGNPATGKMGVALAQAAVQRGARVTLVYANLSELPSESAITAVKTVSSDEMAAELFKSFADADYTFMAAAVADVKPATYIDRKLAKHELSDHLPLGSVLDIAAALGQRKQPGQKLIGFAAQTGDIVTPAQEKLVRKNLDAIVANPIDLPNCGFGSDQNQAVWIDRQGQNIEIPLCSKLAMAHRLLDLALRLQNSR